MKKQYYIVRGNFGNMYNLYWADESNRCKLPPNAERITRIEAYRLAREERYRRHYDSAFAGLADSYIYPAGHDGDINTLRSVDGILMIGRNCFIF